MSKAKIDCRLCKHGRYFSDCGLCKVRRFFGNYWWNRLHNIVTRCYYASHPRYKDYGGRGIGVSPEWYDPATGRHYFEAFRDWCLSHGFRPGLQLDRIDNDRGYYPDNCRFVTAAENSRNRRNTIHVTIDGVEMCGKDACKVGGVPYNLFSERIKHGWNVEAAATRRPGLRRPFLCVHKSHGGRCYAGKCSPCPFSTDEEMRSCANFSK